MSKYPHLSRCVFYAVLVMVPGIAGSLARSALEGDWFLLVPVLVLCAIFNIALGGYVAASVRISLLKREA